MQYRDPRGIFITAGSSHSAAEYDDIVLRLARYDADPFSGIERALAADPGFVSAHCARAALGVMAAERGGEALIRQSLAAARELTPNPREARHLGAAEAWLSGDFARAADRYGALSLDYPRDLLALEVAHVTDFYLGRQRMLRDRVVHALPHWSEETPGVGFVHGMLAFGLEETNLFEQAETAGRRALEHERRDAWAVHAVTHCFEMTGRAAAGAAFLEERRGDWAPSNAFAYHNFWHLALFELEQERTARALELFDEAIWPKPSRVALELVDAASLLFRLYLRGVDVGARAVSVARAWSEPSQLGYYAFNDVHAVMAHVAAGELEEARRVARGLALAAGGEGTNAAMAREVGLPAAEALLAFAEERYDDAIELLWPLRLRAHAFGGSNAQRDFFDLTLGEAARRARRTAVARALAAERRVLRPESPWTRRLAS